MADDKPKKKVSVFQKLRAQQERTSKSIKKGNDVGHQTPKSHVDIWRSITSHNNKVNDND